MLTRFALGMVPVWAWVAVAGAGAMALGGWHLDAVSDARDAGMAEVQRAWDLERAANTAAALKATTEARAKDQRLAADNLENMNEAERLAARLRRNIVAAGAVGDRVRNFTRAAAARCDRSPQVATAAGTSAPAASAGDLLSDLSRGLYEAGLELAIEAQRRGDAGSTCERDADAVRR